MNTVLVGAYPLNTVLNCFLFNFLTLAGSKCSLFVSPAACAPASEVAGGLTIPF
jgi:hypothetical protein